MCPTGKALSVDHDHGCCPTNEKMLNTCGECIRGLLCATCNGRDVLAGAPHVDWSAVMEAARAQPPGEAAPVRPVRLTLRAAIDEGLVPWSKDAAKMRLARARRAGRPVPEPVGKHGRQADLYRRADLAAWVQAEQQTTS